jgi:hypothetical protein
VFATPVPSAGDILVGRDRAGRVLRVGSHPEFDRVVLSIWQDGTCLATVRLAQGDVPDLVRALAAATVPPAGDRRAAAS